MYNDFRELLGRGDIDAVSIATLDSWHVLHALAAVRAGKDLYVEKPLGMSIHEIKVLRDAVHRYGRVFQFGTQQRSSQEFRRACEIARNGRLGKVHTIKVGVHAGAAERSGLKTYTPEPVPDGLDYDCWLGPAPWAPYTTARLVYPHWFHISDYSLGLRLRLGHPPHRHRPVGQRHGTDRPGRDRRLRAVSRRRRPLRQPAQLGHADEVRQRRRADLHRRRAGVHRRAARHHVRRPGRLGLGQPRRRSTPSRNRCSRSRSAPTRSACPSARFHQGNFIECVRTRQPTICNIDVAVRSDTVCQLAWCAFQLQRKLRWDPDQELFVDDPAANQKLTRPLRRLAL